MGTTLHLVGNWPSDVGFAWKMIEQFWIALAKTYPGRTILTFPKVSGLSPELKAAGIEIIEFDFDLAKPAALIQFAKRHQVGHLYLSDRPYFSPVYVMLRRAAGVETITIHDHTPGARTIPTGLKRLGKAAAVRFMGANAYIATTEYVRQRHLNAVGVPPSRCHLARNGVHPSPYARSQSTIRQELGIASEQVLIVSSSRATPIKRIEIIIEAARKLPYAQFIHLGKGADVAYWEHLRTLAPSNFRMLGDRNDVLKILPGCDIGIHAAEGEVGYSLSTLEFMVAGLPVVVRNDPSVSGCIEHGSTGLMFDRDPYPDLVELCVDQKLRARLGDKARHEVLTRYRLQDTIDSVVSIVQRVTGDLEPAAVSPLI